MKKLFILFCILTAITGKCFAYYTVEQIKYEQSVGKTDTLNRAMENPRQFEKMYSDYYNKQNYENNRNNYNRPDYTRERPLYKFGNSYEL